MSSGVVTPPIIKRIKTSAIQAPDSGDNHTTVLRQLKESAEVGQRLRGDIGDSYVRVSELVSLGLATISGNSVILSNGVVAGAPVGIPPPPPSGGADSDTLAGCTDVSLASPAAGQVLTYTGSVWANQNVPVSALAPATLPGLLHWSESDIIATPSTSTVSYLLQRDPYRVYYGNYLSSTNSPLSGPTVDATTLNSLPVLNFPGSSVGNMQFPTGLNLGGTGGASTIFCVLNPNLAAAFSLVSGSNAAYNIQVAGTTGQVLISSDFTLTLITSNSPGLTTGVWQQFNVTYNQSTGAGAFRIARAAAGSGTNASKPSQLTTAAFYNLAGGVSTENYKGLLALLIIYGRVLAAGEITTIENYIFNKYGV